MSITNNALSLSAMAFFLSFSTVAMEPINPQQIMCPVLAALYNAGHLKVDENGRITRDEMERALRKDLLCSKQLAQFQATGVVAYREDDIDEIDRSRTSAEPRYLNICKMHKNPRARHGMGTAIRTIEGPNKERFETFIRDFANIDGKLYWSNFLNIIQHALKEGEHEGEYSYYWCETGEQWQMRGAMAFTLEAFGRRDTRGELYLLVDDLHRLYMEGQYPRDWEKRKCGALLYGSDLPAIKAITDASLCEWGGRTIMATIFLAILYEVIFSVLS